jgi:hypothetical protein
MATNATVTNLDKALKIKYPDSRVKMLSYENHPFYALVPKNEKFYGKRIDSALGYGGNAGGSRTFTNAIANYGPGKIENFQLPRVKDYGIIGIETELLLASNGAGANAFLDAAVSESDRTVRNVSNNTAMSLYRNLGGARGVVSGISSTLLTLTNIEDAVNFEVGMILKQATTDGTSGSIGAAAAVTVTGVNRRTGVLTAAAWTGFSAADFLFREGDFGLAITGLAAYLPVTPPSPGENFLGADRSWDSRLYGIYHNGASQTREEGIIDLATKIFREGGRPTHLFANPTNTAQLAKEMQGRTFYEMTNSPDMAEIGFEALIMRTMAGKIKVISDPDCPVGLGYCLTMSMGGQNCWELMTAGPGPRILDQMGNRFNWSTTADAVIGRVGIYGNLSCHAPAYSGVIAFS